jgi:signal transduction histidine kinase
MPPTRLKETVRPSSSRLLLGAGFLAWGAVALGFVAHLAQSTKGLVPRHAAEGLALAVFAAAFAWSGGQRPGDVKAKRVALALEIAAAVAVAVTERSTLGVVLLVVTAGQLPMVYSSRPIALWLLLQNGAVLAWELMRTTWVDALLIMTSYLAFQGFACVMTYLVEREAEARRALALAHTELAAAQAELGETQRTAERLRIARELHDQIGHQLTALNLQLEVATNTDDREARAAVSCARGLGRELLTDLRGVVTAQRSVPEFDLVVALGGLASRVREPQIQLILRDDPRVTRADAALALFRCGQEATTNAVRHARATRLEIVLERVDGGVQLVARDDGHGAAPVVYGNGLTGLRERLEDIGGRLAVQSLPGSGFTLTAWVADPT